jgi:hypothetical protein
MNWKIFRTFNTTFIMKNLKAWLVLLPMLTAACSNDYQNENLSQNNSLKLKNGTPDISISANPYDNAGVIQNNILEIYESLSPSNSTLIATVHSVDSIAANQPALQLVPLQSYHVDQISWILSHESTALPQILASSSLSVPARLSLQSLVNNIFAPVPPSAEEAIAMITSYVNITKDVKSFSIEEKRILLTVCSLWDYSLRRKRRPDLDWETSVGHIAAMLYGAEQNLDVAVRISSVVGLCHNSAISAVLD